MTMFVLISFPMTINYDYVYSNRLANDHQIMTMFIVIGFPMASGSGNLPLVSHEETINIHRTKR
jgi:hypothetical protein